MSATISTPPSGTQFLLGVHYLLEGAGTAVAVARGEARLAGMMTYPEGKTFRTPDEVRAELVRWGNAPRIYFDAIPARAAERQFGLPTGPLAGDVATLRRLLEHAGQTTHDYTGIAQPPSAVVWQAFASYFGWLNPLRGTSLGAVYERLELPLIDPVVGMTFHGLQVDVAELRRQEGDLVAQSDLLQRQIGESGGPNNPGSDDQVRRYLSAASASATLANQWAARESVTRILKSAASDPILGQVAEWRDLSVWLRGIRQVLTHVDREGVLRGNLNPLGASTGRFGCCGANLLALDKRVRPAVRAREGYLLIEADVALAEFHVLALLSGDQGLLADLTGGHDLHRRTAALVLGKPECQVTAEDRRIGKAVNFGILYGETEYGLAKVLNVLPFVAREYIDGFFRCRPRAREFLESIKDRARSCGFVTTWMGRVRALPDIASAIPDKRHAAERQAANTVIQGTAADLLKQSIIALQSRIPEEWRLLLPVHDSLLLEVPRLAVDAAVRIVKSTFERPNPHIPVPFRIEIKSGLSWS